MKGEDSPTQQLEQSRRVLLEICRVVRAAAAGDLEVRIPDLGITGEAEATRLAINHLLDLTDAFLRESAGVLVSAGEKAFHRKFLVRGMLGSFRSGAEQINTATAVLEEHGGLADNFQRAVKSVAEHVAASATELRATAGELSRTAEETARRATTVAQAASAASGNVGSVAAATEEMSSTVAEIERQVRSTSSAAQGAVAAAARASEVVGGLTLASREIGEVVTVITKVANQTRLLALNASIEAARAGAAGSGFRVVASEVKSLAMQAADATGRITDQVASIQRATGQAVQVIDGIATSIRSVDDTAQVIARAVSEQQKATGEISGSISQAANGVREVTTGIESVSASSNTTSSAATQLDAAAIELAKLSERLQAEVGQFLQVLRDR